METLAFYEKHWKRFAERYDSLDPEVIHASWKDLLPPPCRVLDVGAGSGRDAAWIAGKGYRVTAMEPVAAFRTHGETVHGHERITWIDDRLPACPAVRKLRRRFGLILAGGVWMHLTAVEQQVAMGYLAKMVRPGGRLVLTLRKGPATDRRKVYPVTVSDMARSATPLGMEIIRKHESPDGFQRPNITWLAIVFEKTGR